MDGLMHRSHTLIRPALLALLAGLLTACAASQSRRPVFLEPEQSQRDAAMAPVYQAYDAGDYKAAYRQAMGLTRSPDPTLRIEADYVAGLAAYRLRDWPSAVAHLSRARHAGDLQLAADACATLGAVYVELKQYDRAEEALLDAARKYRGEKRAQAYLHAAIAQQHQEKWTQAQSMLRLARGLTHEPQLQKQIDVYLDRATPAAEYALQIGIFTRRRRADEAMTRFEALARLYRVDQPRLTQVRQIDGEMNYHVTIGRFGNYQEAEATRRRLGWDDLMIVPAP